MHQTLNLGNTGRYRGEVREERHRWYLHRDVQDEDERVCSSQVALAQLVELPVEARSAVVRSHQVALSQDGS